MVENDKLNKKLKSVLRIPIELIRIDQSLHLK